MDGWNTIVSFWGPAYFQGRLLLVLGRVTVSVPLEVPKSPEITHINGAEIVGICSNSKWEA